MILSINVDKHKLGLGKGDPAFTKNVCCSLWGPCSVRGASMILSIVVHKLGFGKGAVWDAAIYAVLFVSKKSRRSGVARTSYLSIQR
jgi:hypothetical protein